MLLLLLLLLLLRPVALALLCVVVVGEVHMLPQNCHEAARVLCGFERWWQLQGVCFVCFSVFLFCSFAVWCGGWVCHLEFVVSAFYFFVRQ